MVFGSEPVPVTVTVYGPAGVQPVQELPPPPPLLLLLLLQAGNKNKAAITAVMIKKPKSRLRRERAELKPIPISDMPTIGSHIA